MKGFATGIVVYLAIGLVFTGIVWGSAVRDCGKSPPDTIAGGFFITLLWPSAFVAVVVAGAPHISVKCSVP